MKKFVLLAIILLVVGFAFSANFSFLLCPKSLNNPYWYAVENGMNAAAKLVGVKAFFDAPVEADAAKQVQTIINYVVKGVNGIAISPNDAEAIKTAIKKALESGIPVITFDADAAAGSGRYVYVGTNNYRGGWECGKLMVDLIKKQKPNDSEIKIAILTGGLAALNLNERIKGFKDYIEQHKDEIPGKVTYVADPFPCNDDTARAIQIIADVSKTYPDLDAWFMAGGWPLFVPVKTFTSAFGGPEKTKKLLIVSFDTLKEELELVKQGYVDGLVGQRPYEMGFKSIMILYNMAVFGVEETLGLLPTVNGDKIVDTGVDVVTKENVDEFLKLADIIYKRNR